MQNEDQKTTDEEVLNQVDAIIYNDEMDAQTAIASLERLRPVLLRHRCQAQADLAKERYQFLLPKNEGTEMERKLHNDSGVAKSEQRLEMLRGYEEIVKDFIATLKALNFWKPF